MSHTKFIKKLLYSDSYHIEDTIILTSSPRSGSSWLAEAWKNLGYDLINEPLFLTRYPDSVKAGYDWRTFIPPNEKDSLRYNYMNQVLTGQAGYVNLTKDFKGLFPTPKQFRKRKLFIKFVRANRLLSWLTNSFNVRGSILLVRHPCAVVSSQIAMGERENSAWKYYSADQTNPKQLYGGDLPSSIIDKYENALGKVKSRAGHLAVVWSFDNLMPLRLYPAHHAVIVSYETLLGNATKELARIYKELGGDEKKVQALNLDTPSLTASPDYRQGNAAKQLTKWKDQLTSSEIDEILAVVHEFDINWYTDDILPSPAFFKEKAFNLAM